MSAYEPKKLTKPPLPRLKPAWPAGDFGQERHPTSRLDADATSTRSPSWWAISKCQCGGSAIIETRDTGRQWQPFHEHRGKCLRCDASTTWCTWKPDAATLWNAMCRQQPKFNVAGTKTGRLRKIARETFGI